jgi:putative PIN family toxin of toxin-antitoxin system
VRVVFDTNVFVSALVFPGGNGEAAVQRVIDGRDQLLVSRAIVGELLEVLARKFARDREELARVAVFVDAIAEVVDPRCAIDALADDADNRILECAVEGRADRIVTGDRAMLALGSYEGIGLVSLSGYLEGDD